MIASLCAASFVIRLLALPFAQPPAALASLAPASFAFGLPLICQELAIGDAKSLPWESGTKPKASYDRAHLASDVAQILEREKSLLVRMETLRRASLYAREDRALAWELVGARALAVLEQHASAPNVTGEAAAWFDLGVLIGCFDQLDVDFDFHVGVAEGIEGYAYLRKALDAARANGSAESATIEFAAVLVTHPAMARSEPARERRRVLHDAHLERAQEGCANEPLLARNVAAFRARFEG